MFRLYGIGLTGQIGRYEAVRIRSTFRVREAKLYPVKGQAS